jgi:hypothetical protein
MNDIAQSVNVGVIDLILLRNKAIIWPTIKLAHLRDGRVKIYSGREKKLWKSFKMMSLDGDEPDSNEYGDTVLLQCTFYTFLISHRSDTIAKRFHTAHNGAQVAQFYGQKAPKDDNESVFSGYMLL